MRSAGRYYGWIIVLGSCALTVVGSGLHYSFGVLLPELQREFGCSWAVLSAIFSMFAIFEGAGNILFGALSDRFGPTLPILIAAVMVSVGLLFSAMTKSALQIFLSYGILFGLGIGAHWSVPNSVINRWFDNHPRRGLALGIVAAGVGLGTLIMPGLISYIITSMDWRTCFLIEAPIAGMFFIFSALLLRHSPQRRKPIMLLRRLEAPERRQSSSSKSRCSALETLRNSSYWTIVIGFAALEFTLHIIMVHVVPYALTLGFPSNSAARVIMLIGASSIAGKLLMGGASDKIGAKAVFVFSAVTNGLAVLLLVGINQQLMLYIFALVFGFSYGGYIPQMVNLLATVASRDQFGTLFGIMTFVVLLGAAIGGVLGGYVRDVTGSYQCIFIAGGILCILVGAIVPVLLRQPYINRTE